MAFVQLQPVQMWIPGTYPGAPPQQMFLCSLGCLVAQTVMMDHQSRAHP